MNAVNIKDLLAQSLSKTGKKDQVISSLVWNSIIHDFLEIKKIDITEFIISIKVVGPCIKIKTQKPILNTEILNLQETLLQNINQKVRMLGIYGEIKKIHFQ